MLPPFPEECPTSSETSPSHMQGIARLADLVGNMKIVIEPILLDYHANVIHSASHINPIQMKIYIILHLPQIDLLI